MGKGRGRLALNFARQSKHWSKGSVRMETLSSFALELRKGYRLMSWDIKSGYRHFYLHPCMREFFLFHFDGRFYLCLSLPVGRRRSVLGKRAAGPWDCRRAQECLGRLFNRLGVVRHPSKGCWDGASCLEHLGVVLDTESMKAYVPGRKLVRVGHLAQELLHLASRNGRLVPAGKLRSFADEGVSLTLAFPMARFYTRAIYRDLARAEAAARECAGVGWNMSRKRMARVRVPDSCTEYRTRSNKSGLVDCVRLSRQSLRDLHHFHWKNWQSDRRVPGLGGRLRFGSGRD